MLSGMLFALALSVDGFVVGVQYGMRRIALPSASLAVVALCTGAGMALSMFIGGLFSGEVGSETGQRIGGMILILLGLWQLSQGWVEYARRSQDREPGSVERPLAAFRIPSLGIIVEIVTDPMQADSDHSGAIDLYESLALGAALGLDTLGAGFAASMLGFGPSLIALVAGSIVIVVRIGVALGHVLDRRSASHKWLMLPGLILIAMGLVHL